MWLVMVSQRWDALTTNVGALTVPPDYGTRFLPVFDTAEEAQRYYPDADLVEIRDKPIQQILRGPSERLSRPF